MGLRNALVAVVTAGLLSAPVGAFAQPMADGPHHGGLELLRGVGLTDTQKQQVRAIVRTGHTQIAPIAERMRAVRDQLAGELLGSTAVTETQLQPLVSQEEDLRAQLDEQRLAVALQIRNLLTPQQLAQAAALHGKLSDLHRQERALLRSDRPGSP